MRSRTLWLTVGAVALALVPLVADAATLPFFGPIIPDSPAWNGGTCAVGWGGVLIVINNLILFLLTAVILFVAPLTIAYAGFLYVVNPVSPSGRGKANNIMQNLVIGIVVALASWLIVDGVMAVLYDKASFGAWYNIITTGGQDPCLKVAGSLSPLAPTLPNSRVVQSSGGGACVAWNSGACGTSNMGAFGAAASQAAQICSAESANGTLLTSTLDKIQPTNAPVSFGLFQINISANPVAGLNCPAAFACPNGKTPCPYVSGSNTHVNIINDSLYASCKAAALTPSSNIVAAAQIYQTAHNTWKPWGAASKCQLASASSSRVAAVCNLIALYE